MADQHRARAKTLLASIDPKDAGYVALAFSLGTVLWTVDGKLARGLLRKGVHVTIDTRTMRHLVEQV